MSAPAADPGHLLPVEEWERVVAEAEAIVRGEHRKLMRAGRLPRASRSAFPSVTGFVPARYDGGARPGAPTFGVWHDAETPLSPGYALAIANYFTRNTNSTSAHFMLGPDAGYQLLDTARVAWHCGNGNPRSIGVENCGYARFTAADWLTAAAGIPQLHRGATLIREIRAVHGIEPRWMTDPAEILACHHGEHVGGWITHDQASQIIGGSSHTDPMPTYPLQQLMQLANQEDDVSAETERQIDAINGAVAGLVVKISNPKTGLYDQLQALRAQVAVLAAAMDPKALAAALAQDLPVASGVSEADLEKALRTVLGSVDNTSA